MKSRDIVIGIVVVVMLGGAIYFSQKRSSQEDLKVPETLSTEDQLEEKFKIQIPEDVDKAELKDLGGGTASGIATRKFLPAQAGADSKFSFTALADLPDPDAGSFYQGWLTKGESGKEGFSMISVGRLSQAKGGWMLNFNSSTDFSDYGNVLISSEKTQDSKTEKRILGGSF